MLINQEKTFFSARGNFVGVLFSHLIPAVFVKLEKKKKVLKRFTFSFFYKDRDRFNDRIMNLIQFTLVQSH